MTPDEQPEEWAPLPPRRNKRSRPAAGGMATADQDSQAAKEDHSSREAMNLEKVNEAVRRRTTLQRAERGDDMGKDGMAGEFYEYLDHTADVQLHAWGPSLRAAFENIVPCMSNYMTDISTITIDERRTQEFDMESHDLPSLLFGYLDEFLYRFNVDGMVCKRATILQFDREHFRIRVRSEGEPFDLERHPQGTEVKAITYSNMQIHEKEDRSDLYVIVDI